MSKQPIPPKKPLPRKTVQVLVGIDQTDLDWLEDERKRLGFRSRTETLRSVIARARSRK